MALSLRWRSLTANTNHRQTAIPLLANAATIGTKFAYRSYFSFRPPLFFPTVLFYFFVAWHYVNFCWSNLPVRVSSQMLFIPVLSDLHLSVSVSSAAGTGWTSVGGPSGTLPRYVLSRRCRVARPLPRPGLSVAAAGLPLSRTLTGHTAVPALGHCGSAGTTDVHIFPVQVSFVFAFEYTVSLCCLSDLLIYILFV